MADVESPLEKVRRLNGDHIQRDRSRIRDERLNTIRQQIAEIAVVAADFFTYTFLLDIC